MPSGKWIGPLEPVICTLMEDVGRALESRMSFFQVAWEVPVVSLSFVQFSKTEPAHAASGAGRMDQLVKGLHASLKTQVQGQAPQEDGRRDPIP